MARKRVTILRYYLIRVMYLYSLYYSDKKRDQHVPIIIFFNASDSILDIFTKVENRVNLCSVIGKYMALSYFNNSL